jgi:hypothetical protein
MALLHLPDSVDLYIGRKALAWPGSTPIFAMVIELLEASAPVAAAWLYTRRRRRDDDEPDHRAQ